jgi:acyl carrier protein
MDNLREQVQDLFRDVFEDDQIVLQDSTTAADIDGWDSLMHINLVIALERRFSIRMATAEIARLKADGQNLGALLQLLATKLGKKPG